MLLVVTIFGSFLPISMIPTHKKGEGRRKRKRKSFKESDSPGLVHCCHAEPPNSTGTISTPTTSLPAMALLPAASPPATISSIIIDASSFTSHGPLAWCKPHRHPLLHHLRILLLASRLLPACSPLSLHQCITRVRSKKRSTPIATRPTTLIASYPTTLAEEGNQLLLQNLWKVLLGVVSSIIASLIIYLCTRRTLEISVSLPC
jgi:hypothetical protein